MLSSVGVWTRLPLDREAAGAPVVAGTCRACRLYAAAQAPISGNSSVLPVSDRVCGPGAGADTITGLEGAEANPAAFPEPGVPLPPHALASASGTAVTAASSTRYRSATDRYPSFSA